jgi:hypothetical protein
VLDGCVSVADITEVVDIAGAEESSGGEGVNRCVTPL